MRKRTSKRIQPVCRFSYAKTSSNLNRVSTSTQTKKRMSNTIALKDVLEALFLNASTIVMQSLLMRADKELFTDDKPIAPNAVKLLVRRALQYANVDFKIYTILLLAKFDPVCYKELIKTPRQRAFMDLFSVEYDTFLVGLKPGSDGKYSKEPSNDKLSHTIPYFIQTLRTAYLNM